MIIMYVGLLQVWAYEHIDVIRLMGLQHVREDPTDVAMVC